MKRCRILYVKHRRAPAPNQETIRRLRKCGTKWQEVLAILGDLPKEDLHVSVFTAAATALRRAARWEEAVQLLVQMPKVAVQPDVFNFNATITACSSASQWQAASHLLDSMETLQVAPDVISYNALLSACDRAAETRQAMLCMARMRSLKVTPDQTSYSTLMSAVSRSGEWQIVLHLLSEMHQMKVQTDHVCYSVAMGSCEKASEWLMALDLFEAMQKQRLQRDVVTFGNAMCAMTKGGSADGALRLLSTMRTEAIELDTVVCNSCLGACANAARWQEALDLLRLMTDHKLNKTTATCNAVVRALEGGGEHRRAVAVLLHDFVDEEVEDQCVRPSMFRTARPTQITAQLRASIAERLERALDFGKSFEFQNSESSDLSDRNEPRPLVAIAAENIQVPAHSPGGACPFALRDLLESLAPLAPDGTDVDYQELLSELEASLPASLQGAKVIPYGSIISRFAAVDADADFSVLKDLPVGAGQVRHFQQRALIEWRRELLSRGYDVSAIGLGGRVPVLTFRWGPSQTRSADVTIGNQLGIYKSRLLREYSLLDERLCDLVMAVKCWAKLRQISGQTRGYLGGYAWTLMSIYFAQCCSPPLVPSLQAMAMPEIWEEGNGHGQRYNVAWTTAESAKLAVCSPATWTSASLLHGFFDFFSKRFDFTVESASVRLGCRAVKAMRSTDLVPPRLSLEDPIETDWDLGQILSTFRMARLRAELRRAERLLRHEDKGFPAVFQARGARGKRS